MFFPFPQSHRKVGTGFLTQAPPFKKTVSLKAPLWCEHKDIFCRILRVVAGSLDPGRFLTSVPVSLCFWCFLLRQGAVQVNSTFQALLLGVFPGVWKCNQFTLFSLKRPHSHFFFFLYRLPNFRKISKELKVWVFFLQLVSFARLVWGLHDILL